MGRSEGCRGELAAEDDWIYRGASIASEEEKRGPLPTAPD